MAHARALDPQFALYAARWAWSADAPVEERAAGAAGGACRRGVSALWLRAGSLALEAGWSGPAREALLRAQALDPLSAFAPFQLASLGGGRDAAVPPADCAARALAAEPRLVAASFWRGREGQRRAAIDRLEHWPGIDAGWRSEMLTQTAAATEPMPSGAPQGAGVDEVEPLAAQIDTTPALAVSLHLFRRSPWPADVARIRVERAGVRRDEVAERGGAARVLAGGLPAGALRPELRSSTGSLRVR